MNSKIGLLLVNLGTPESPSPKDVGVYLREFLMDPLVIDIPAFYRFLLVNFLIVPFRSRSSASLYQKVWTDRGSPLLFHSQDLTEKVSQEVGEHATTRLAMRYGNPSIREGLEAFHREGIRRVVVFPLYPQYSLAATESSVQKVRSVAKAEGWQFDFEFVPPFYIEKAFIDAFEEVGRPFIDKGFDKVLFSFHGLPERQVKKTDPSGQYCLEQKSCCEKIVSENVLCYRAHCYATARELARRFSLSDRDYVIGFQSRLGRTPWIQPYSDKFYETLPAEGVKRLLVFSPSFVADCLETLEEIAIRGNEQFRENGGEKIELVPSLNSEDIWVKAVVQLASKALGEPLS